MAKQTKSVGSQKFTSFQRALKDGSIPEGAMEFYVALATKNTDDVRRCVRARYPEKGNERE